MSFDFSNTGVAVTQDFEPAALRWSERHRGVG